MPPSLVDQLKAMKSIADANRSGAIGIINTQFDAVNTAIDTAVTEIAALTQPTPPPAVAAPVAPPVPSPAPAVPLS